MRNQDRELFVTRACVSNAPLVEEWRRDSAIIESQPANGRHRQCLSIAIVPDQPGLVVNGFEIYALVDYPTGEYGDGAPLPRIRSFRPVMKDGYECHVSEPAAWRACFAFAPRSASYQCVRQTEIGRLRALDGGVMSITDNQRDHEIQVSVGGWLNYAFPTDAADVHLLVDEGTEVFKGQPIIELKKTTSYLVRQTVVDQGAHINTMIEDGRQLKQQVNRLQLGNFLSRMMTASAFGKDTDVYDAAMVGRTHAVQASDLFRYAPRYVSILTRESLGRMAAEGIDLGDDLKSDLLQSCHERFPLRARVAGQLVGRGVINCGDDLRPIAIATAADGGSVFEQAVPIDSVLCVNPGDRIEAGAIIGYGLTEPFDGTWRELRASLGTRFGWFLREQLLHRHMIHDGETGCTMDDVLLPPSAPPFGWDMSPCKEFEVQIPGLPQSVYVFPPIAMPSIDAWQFRLGDLFFNLKPPGYRRKRRPNRRAARRNAARNDSGHPAVDRDADPRDTELVSVVDRDVDPRDAEDELVAQIDRDVDPREFEPVA